MRHPYLDRVEFYLPFHVDSAGEVRPADDTVSYVPEVYHDEDYDVTLDMMPHDSHTQWSVFSVGYTGQYGYRGAVMHASETLSGKLAEDILSNPGVYVLMPVEVFPVNGDDEPEPAGWTVLRMREG